MKITVRLLAACLVGLVLPRQMWGHGARTILAPSAGHWAGPGMLWSQRQNYQSAQPGDTASAPHLSFTVASVRQSLSEGKPTSNVPLTPGSSYSPFGSSFSASNQAVFVYILFAYKVRISEAWDLLSRLPKWAVSERYDIQAKTDQKDPTKDQVREMMRTLLQERFALRAHWETVQRSVLALEVRKKSLGPQLQKHVGNTPCSAQASLNREQVMTMTPMQLLGRWPYLCEGDQVSASQHTRAGMRDQNMDDAAAWLSGEGDTDLPIVNRTGLSGTYDLILDFKPEHGPDLENSRFPTFAEALSDQLGLTLKKQEGAATVFVVDHLERPSAN